MSSVSVRVTGPNELVFQVGQAHGGLLGMIQRAMVKSSAHIWFDRSEVKDRHTVAKR